MWFAAHLVELGRQVGDGRTRWTVLEALHRRRRVLGSCQQQLVASWKLWTPRSPARSAISTVLRQSLADSTLCAVRPTQHRITNSRRNPSLRVRRPHPRQLLLPPFCESSSNLPHNHRQPDHIQRARGRSCRDDSLVRAYGSRHSERREQRDWRLGGRDCGI